MANFLALTSRGLEPAVLAELEELGIKNPKEKPLGVEFESNWQGCYRANFLLRSASRVILPILDFHAYNADDLYHHLMKHDFTKYIEPGQTISIDGKTRLSNVFRDQRFLAHKAKDAIVDQFRKKFGERPNVDTKNPDLRVLIRVVKTSVSVAIDTSGESLSHRGYRQKSVMAPLREHMAAGLLRMAGWKPETPLVDPMCGSGTFLIEAALWATGRAPAAKRSDFGFMHLKGFQREVWDKVRQEGTRARSRPLALYGFDRSAEAIRAAKGNAERAGVLDLIRFRVGDIQELKRPAGPKGIVIVNPPYGERLGEQEKLIGLYTQFANVLKREFPDWNAWILSGSEALSEALHLKAERRIRVYNGTLECRFLNYPIR